MSEDTLNEKFWEAIDNNIDSYENHIWGKSEAANECEKICIQSQIDLLNEICDNANSNNEIETYDLCVSKLQSLNNKLNSLK